MVTALVLADRVGDGEIYIGGRLAGVAVTPRATVAVPEGKQDGEVDGGSTPDADVVSVTKGEALKLLGHCDDWGHWMGWYALQSW